MRGVGASGEELSITRLTRRETWASRAATAMIAVASSKPFWRVGKIDRRNAADRALRRTDVEKIPDEDFGPELRQALRTRVRRVHEGANRCAAREQHLGYVPTGLALPAARCSGDENQSLRHGQLFLYSWLGSGTLKYH